jgi:hypothetical protein
MLNILGYLICLSFIYVKLSFSEINCIYFIYKKNLNTSHNYIELKDFI